MTVSVEEVTRYVGGEGADENAGDARRNTPPTLPAFASTLLPNSWRRSTAALVTSGLIRRERDKCIIVCVCDSKASGNGKNVYTRLLINSLLLSSGDEVAVIDGDCVQPEFAAPGTISLALLRKPLGAPGAAHFTSGTMFRQGAEVPLKSFFVGSSQKYNPAFYLARVNELIHCWRSLSASPPSLVINCCGWTKGIGADLVGKTIVAARATHVINLSSRVESVALSSHSSSRKLSCAGIERTFWSTSQYEEAMRCLRDEETLARYNVQYMRRAAGKLDTAVANWKVPTPNKHAPQAKKSWSEANRGALQWLVWGLNCVVAHYSSSHSTLTHSPTLSILKSLRGKQGHHAGKPLGVWEMLSQGFTQISPWRVNFADVQIYGNDGWLIDPLQNASFLTGCVVGLAIQPARTSDRVGECVGVGMIRALNTRSQKLYVVAPLSPLELEKVSCLLVRDVQNPPFDFFKSAGGLVASSPYVCSNGLATEGTGARAIRSRNNILRKA